MNKSRPKFLALYQIRLPLPGTVSILHRISGVLLFFPGLPLVLWMLQASLHSAASYNSLLEDLRQPLAKLPLLLLLWALLHHFCAGIRYLLIDMDIGVGLAQARESSKWVLGVSLALTLLLGARLW